MTVAALIALITAGIKITRDVVEAKRSLDDELTPEEVQSLRSARDAARARYKDVIDELLNDRGDDTRDNE